MNRCLSNYSGFKPRRRKVFADVEGRNLFSEIEGRNLLSEIEERNLFSEIEGRNLFQEIEERNLFPEVEERSLFSEIEDRNLFPEVEERFHVEPQDVVFVTVTAMGRTVLSTAVTGRSSVEELIGGLKMLLPGVQGMLTVNMRNRSNGTVARRSVRLNKPATGLMRAQMKGYAA